MDITKIPTNFETVAKVIRTRALSIVSFAEQQFSNDTAIVVMLIMAGKLPIRPLVYPPELHTRLGCALNHSGNFTQKTNE